MVRKILVGLVASAVLNAFAQDSEVPVNCTSQNVRDRVICSYDDLLVQAKKLELNYLAELAAVTPTDWSQLGLKKIQWKGRYIECGLLIGKRPEMARCIADAMSILDQQLRPSELALNRSAALHAATTRMSELEAEARLQRLTCFRHKTAEIDDGVSSARDIAVVVTKTCRPLTWALTQIMAANIEALPLFSAEVGVSPEAILDMTNQLSNPDDLVAAVLELRAVRRATKPKATTTKPRAKTVEG